MISYGGPTIANPDRMDLEAVKAIIGAKDKNPTIDKLIFMETRKTKKVDRKVFPCYPVHWDEEEKILTVAIAQCSESRYFFGYVRLPEDQIGEICRFWNMPPNDDLMNLDPLKPSEAEEKPDVADAPVINMPVSEDPLQ